MNHVRPHPGWKPHLGKRPLCGLEPRTLPIRRKRASIARMIAARSDVGVLFVHGIGEQAKGQTLARFADPVLKLILSWAVAGTETTAELTGGSTSSSANADPAAATLTVTHAGSSKRIEFAESWWAASFAPGGYTRTAFWGIRFVWRVINRLRAGSRAASAFTRASLLDAVQSTSLLSAGISVWGAFGGLFIAISVGVIGVDLLLLAGVTTAAAGLVALFVMRLLPGQGERAARLQLRVANSLGDAQVFLNSPSTAQAMISQVTADLAWLQNRCDRLVVIAHSQGTVVAHSALTSSNCPPLHVAAFCTAGSALTIFNTPSIAAQQVPMDAEHFFPVQRDADRLLRENLRTQAYWTGQARRFRSLYPGARWQNYWSACDPVPAGPFSVRAVPGLEEFQIQNTGSFLRDHTAYSKNGPQFVASLTEVILAAAGLTPEAHFGVPPERLTQARRAQQRLFRLRSRARLLGWIATFALTLGLVYSGRGRSIVTWSSAQQQRLGPKLPSWLGHVHISHFLLAPVLASFAVGVVFALYSGMAAIGQAALNAHVGSTNTGLPRRWSVMPYIFNAVLLAPVFVLLGAGALHTDSDTLTMAFFLLNAPIAMLLVLAFTLDPPMVYDDTGLEKAATSLRAPSEPPTH